MSQLRVVIKEADRAVTEEVKWRKPSKPAGVPVWSHDGILCIGETLKSAVRLTFPKGALIKDPKKLFNTRLESRTVRAIDFHEDETIDEAALKALIVEDVKLNDSRLRSHRCAHEACRRPSSYGSSCGPSRACVKRDGADRRFRTLSRRLYPEFLAHGCLIAPSA